MPESPKFNANLRTNASPPLSMLLHDSAVLKNPSAGPGVPEGDHAEPEEFPQSKSEVHPPFLIMIMNYNDFWPS